MMKKTILQLIGITASALICLLPASAHAMESRTTANLRGVDVSHWNKLIDWSSVKRSGIRFAYIKACGGTTPTDVMFSTNASGARKNGIAVGAYDYATPTAPYNARQAVSQATTFVRTMRAGLHGYGDIMPVLDVETSGGLTNTQLVAWIQTFVSTVQGQTHRRVMLYTSEYFMQQHGNFNNQLKTMPLWVAYYDRYYGGRNPANIGGWYRWVMWQYSDEGTVSGVTGSVDLDAGPTSLSVLRGYLYTKSPTTSQTGSKTTQAVATATPQPSAPTSTTSGSVSPGGSSKANIHSASPSRGRMIPAGLSGGVLTAKSLVEIGLAVFLLGGLVIVGVNLLVFRRLSNKK